ncbi:hypothetical protein SDC9_124490 [bioreactor metagenome]|uniref:Uncharacterized protein n=1 Tax=bioreactor metagenome TaxID=1076179 RepID=A0A645CKM4_9ZZZZ
MFRQQFSSSTGSFFSLFKIPDGCFVGIDPLFEILQNIVAVFDDIFCGVDAFVHSKAIYHSAFPYRAAAFANDLNIHSYADKCLVRDGIGKCHRPAAQRG